jgi:gas vesicle protein
MKGKIFLSFMVGMALGSALGAGAAIWLQPRESHKGVEVRELHRDKSGAIYQIEVP